MRVARAVRARRAVWPASGQRAARPAHPVAAWAALEQVGPRVQVRQEDRRARAAHLAALAPVAPAAAVPGRAAAVVLPGVRRVLRAAPVLVGSQGPPVRVARVAQAPAVVAPPVRQAAPARRAGD